MTFYSPPLFSGNLKSNRKSNRKPNLKAWARSTSALGLLCWLGLVAPQPWAPQAWAQGAGEARPPVTSPAAQTETSIETPTEASTETQGQESADPSLDYGTDYGTVETLIVTGLPQITRNMGELKIDTDGVLDTLTNAEIELVTDFSLSEAATRIPGVYGVAFNSQPRWLSLRGFDARYNSTDLDGNPIWNSSENNRGTQLDLLPSSAVNQIDVVKSLTADIDPNSIGGHISVRTLRAFDGGTQPYVKARAQYAHFDQDNGRLSYRTDAVGKYTFNDGNMGVVFGVDLQKRNLYQDYFNLKDGLQALADGDALYEITTTKGTWRYERQDIHESNESYFAKFERRQSDQLYSFVTVNFYRVEDSVDTDRRRIYLDASSPKNVGHGLGTAKKGNIGYQIVDFTRDIDTLLLAGGVDYRLGDDSLVKARASWSRVRLVEDYFSSGKFEEFATWKVERDFDLTGDLGTFVLSDPTKGTDPNDYNYGGKTYEEKTVLDDDLYSVRVDYDKNTYADSLGLGYRAGVWFRRLERDHDRRIGEAGLNNGVTYSLADYRPDLTAVDIHRPDLSIDRGRYYQFLAQNSTRVEDDAANRGADYHLTEDVYAAYGMGLYATQKWRVIAGLRYEQTDVSDKLYRVEDGVVLPDRFSHSYNKTLPSVHVSYAPRENIRFRTAYTETMARPDFEAFAFGTSIKIDGTSRTTVKGNPNLGPRLSENIDFSGEYYFAELDGYVAVGLFSKDLSNEHFSQTTVIDNPADPTGAGKLRTTTFSDNGSAKLRGIETSFVINQFDMLAAPFNGLGLIANYTYLDGEWDVVLDDGTRRTIDSLRQQPKQMLNVTGTYKWRALTSSLAYNWSDEAFSGEFETRPTSAARPALNDIYYAPFGTLDAKLAYEMPSGLTVTFAAKNLTDETYQRKTGSNRDLASTHSQFGRSFYLGAQIKY